MAVSSANSVKAQLAQLLGSNGLPYWRALSDFLAGKTSRTEFEKDMRQWINTPELVQLHNSLLTAMLVTSQIDNSKDSTSPASSSQPSRKKRRRVLPHQDPAPRLRRWIVGLKKAERDRIRTISSSASSSSGSPYIQDEIKLERPIALRREYQNPAGAMPHVPLSSQTRALPSTQNIGARISLIAAQHNMKINRAVPALASAAIEAFIKQLSMDALALTVSPLAVSNASSSNPLSTHLPSSATPTLSLSSFAALLTVVPSSLPHPSAAADKLFLRGTLPDEPDDTRQRVQQAVEAGLEPDLAQYLALLEMRSGVREYLEGA
ncbi:hypothetical protein DL93DRAFT_2087244 [Clavulina sp. PMI_390]|nr:hypothetical protein DL93DRAFT_2087244 [Clavulina sp. PMI_390]